MNRRGFTLTELLIGLTVMAILGVALTRILVNDSRFVSRQDAMLASRQGARAALNSVLAELSMLGDAAMVAASRDSLTAWVPYAFGITCRSPSTSIQVASMMPVDSIVWASKLSPSISWRRQTGAYTQVSPVTVANAAASDSSYCRQDSVRVIPGGKLIRVSGLPTSVALHPESLAVVVVQERVTYRFGPSTDLPGRIGLWRQLSGGLAEELVAPFDTSARFAYLMGGPKSATVTLRTTNVTGAGLDSIRGVELRLYAASQNIAPGTSAPQVFPLKTRVRFANKLTS